jgi:hypothetical protein
MLPDLNKIVTVGFSMALNTIIKPELQETKWRIK